MQQVRLTTGSDHPLDKMSISMSILKLILNCARSGRSARQREEHFCMEPLIMSAIWRAAVEQLDEGNDFVIATILSVQGSSPRHVGTRFIVRRDGVIVGTIGGGLFEAGVRRYAESVLEQGETRRVLFSFRGANASSTEMVCGGDADVLIEFVSGADDLTGQMFRRLLELTRNRRTALFLTNLSVPPGGNGPVEHLLVDDEGNRLGGFAGCDEVLRSLPNPRALKPAQTVKAAGSDNEVLVESLKPMGIVYIFGAGHVGECVAHLAAFTDFRVVVMDDRSDFARPERLPDADSVVVTEAFRDLFTGREVDEDAYVVIVTRGHAHDKTVLAQALCTKAGYIGMIGSRRKTRVIFDALLQEGFTEEDLRRVNAPIGLPIGGETPQEIAVSIVAEMIQIRNRKERKQSSVCMG